MSATLISHLVANATVRAHASEAIEMNGRNGGIPYEDVVRPCRSHTPRARARQCIQWVIRGTHLFAASSTLVLTRRSRPTRIEQFAGYATSLAAAGTVYFVNNAFNRGFADSNDVGLTMAPSTLVLHLSGR